MKIKVLIADDHQIIREGLVNLMKEHSDIEVIGEADNGRSAIELTRKLNPDIVLIDIGMPELNGVEATRQILKEHPQIKIIALSAYSDKQFVLGMLKAGAKAYLTKESAFHEIKDAIYTVRSGKVFLCKEVADIVVGEAVSKTENSENPIHNLSGREIEILQLITEGNSTKIIAEKLFISTKTVESHRKNIMSKLNMYSIPELTKYAIRHGITPLND